MTTAEYLEGILSRCEKATPGPWRRMFWKGPIDGHPVMFAHGPRHPTTEEGINATGQDMEFITDAHTDLPRVTLALKTAMDFLTINSKRSSYKWSEGGGYTNVDYVYEGKIRLAQEAIAEIEKILEGK